MAYPAIFFCFEDNPNDKLDAPNKIFLDKEAPTLGDFAAALKSVFKLSDALSFRLSGDEATFYSDDSLVLAPINERNRIVFVRLGGMIRLPSSLPAHLLIIDTFAAPPDVVEAAGILMVMFVVYVDTTPIFTLIIYIY